MLVVEVMDFSSYKQLLHYTQKILDENLKFKDEFYTNLHALNEFYKIKLHLV